MNFTEFHQIISINFSFFVMLSHLFELKSWTKGTIRSKKDHYFVVRMVILRLCDYPFYVQSRFWDRFWAMNETPGARMRVTHANDVRCWPTLHHDVLANTSWPPSVGKKNFWRWKSVQKSMNFIDFSIYKCIKLRK